MGELMDFKRIIEAAGAEFVRVENGSVRFRDPETRAVLSLYLFACNAENVRLTLKKGPWRWRHDQGDGRRERRSIQHDTGGHQRNGESRA
jgi:hypothetical protein